MAIKTYNNNNGGVMMVPTELVYWVIELLGSDPVWSLLPPPQKSIDKIKFKLGHTLPPSIITVA